MTTNYAGNPANYPANIREPDDGDLSNSTKLAAAIEDLADRTANLKARFGLGTVMAPSMASPVGVATTSATYVDVTNATYDETGLAVGDLVEGTIGPMSVELSDGVGQAIKLIITPFGESANEHEMLLMPPATGVRRFGVITWPFMFLAAHAVSHNFKLQVKSNGTDTAYIYGWGGDSLTDAKAWIQYRIWRPGI
jgi:hypothetical protein